MHRWTWLGAIGVILVLLLFFSRSSGSHGDELQWAAVSRGDFSIELSETGEIRAVQAFDVKAPMEWRMELQIIDMVPEGTIVQKGDFLVQFDVSTLLQRLDSEKDALQVAYAEKEKLVAEQEARMRELQARLETARYSREIARLQKELLKFEAEVRRQDAELAFKKALIEYEEAETAIESQKIIDEARLNSAELRILKAKNNVAELERKIAQMTLKAPIGGMVVYEEIGNWNSRRKAAVGEKVRPGQTVVSIPNMDAMQVNLRVNEMDALKLHVGQEAVVTLDAYPDKRFTGKVSEISRIAEKENWRSRIKDFLVVVRIAETDTLLKPGMTAKADLRLGLLEDVLQVPIGTVFEQDGRPVVFPKRTFPKPLPVEIGERNDDFVVIDSDELEPGDRIAFRPPSLAFRRIGYAEYAAAREHDAERLRQAFDEMEKLGLAYDYEGARNKRVIAEADSGAVPPDVEKLRQQFRALGRQGKAGELDPALMKKLRAAMKGGKKKRSSQKRTP